MAGHHAQGYLHQLTLSRKLEREAGRNIVVMWLTGKLVPDFKTIADFRRDNAGAIQIAWPRRRKSHSAIYLRSYSQIGAVIRSREYRLRKTAFGPLTAEAGAQPNPHNPRKQRKNPAEAGSGERVRYDKWRRERDSNP